MKCESVCGSKSNNVEMSDSDSVYKHVNGDVVDHIELSTKVKGLKKKCKSMKKERVL